MGLFALLLFYNFLEFWIERKTYRINDEFRSKTKSTALHHVIDRLIETLRHIVRKTFFQVSEVLFPPCHSLYRKKENKKPIALAIAIVAELKLYIN